MTEELELDSPLEEEELDADSIQAEHADIFTDQSDPEIDSLYNKWKRGELIVQPDFQRQFVWDPRKSSRLIESALLNIPLPIVYISQEKDGCEYVIDGQQRLTSFFSFIDGKFPDDRRFKLSGLNVFREYNNKSFADLPKEEKNKIQYYTIRTIKFKKQSDPTLKFEIFERLNTGSVSLNPQELRNCTYRGKYNDLLKELSLDSDFCYIMGISRPHKRMQDVEFVLRFCAFYNQTYLKYKPPMKNFLNQEMRENQFISDDKAEELRDSFKNTVRIIKSIFDKHSFKRYHKGDSETYPDGHWEPTKFNASLYDIMMYSFAKENQNTIYSNLDAIREAAIHLMTADQEFIDSIELSTSSLQAVTKRFDKWRSTLEKIVGVQHREPRCFTSQLKTELFNMYPACQICNNQIHSKDDAAIDHIEQYWLGGKTIPENARLVHRYCNWSRPRR